MDFGIRKALKVLSVQAASAAPGDRSVGQESSDSQHSSVAVVVKEVVVEEVVVEEVVEEVVEGQKRVSGKHC